MSVKHKVSLTLYNGSTVDVRVIGGGEPKGLLINDETEKDCIYEYKSLNITADESFTVAVNDSNGRLVCLMFSTKLTFGS